MSSTPESYAPPLFSVGLSAVAALLVVGLVAPAPAPLGLAVLGTAVGAVGVVRDREGALTVGATGLFGGVLLVGIAGRSPAWLLAASVPVVLAWVVARHACRLGRQIGTGARTLRVELVHAVATLTVLVGGGVVGYVAHRSVTGSPSPLALGLVLLAVVAFSVTLR